MTSADSLEEGRQAAFHGAPVVGIAPLQALVVTADAPDVRDEARWLLSVCLGASGLYGSALGTLEPLWDSLHFAGHGHLVAASIYRQLGLFDIARRHDEQAMASRSASVRCEALIGLAADFVGLAEPTLAASHLAQAGDSWQATWWREGIRLQWVNAEIALLTNSPTDALDGLQEALVAARAHGAPRHAAKTLGFFAVSLHLSSPHDPAVCAQAIESIAQAADSAQTLAAWPLVWAFRRIQWHWRTESGGEGAATAQIQEQAIRAVSLILADLPPDRRPGFRRRPDVADLLS